MAFGQQSGEVRWHLISRERETAPPACRLL